MTRRYTGGLLSATEQITDANTANGIFTLQEAGALTSSGNFPIGRWTPQRSLRFRASASAYLTRTPSIASGQDKWTLSTWVKRGLNGAAQHIIGGNTTTSGGTRNVLQVEFGGDNAFWVFAFNNGSGYYFQRTSNQLFRDPSAWYHVVVQFDPDNAVSANKVIVYVNGQQLTWSTSSDSGAAGNISSPAYRSINNTYRNDINGGYQGGGAPIYFGDGYLSEMYMISGSVVAPSDFATTDPETGTWVPKRYTGTYGSNGFYLPFSDNATTTGLGKSYSPNTNLITYSEQIDNAAWAKTSTTVAANTTDTTDPLGTNTSEKLTASVTGSSYVQTNSLISFTQGGTYTWSMYAKAGTASCFALSIQPSYADRIVASYNLSTGTVIGGIVPGGTTSTVVGCGMDSVGNGWYRCWLTATTASGSGYTYFGPTNTITTPSADPFSNTSGNTCYVWGAQLNNGPLTTYVQSVASAVSNDWTVNNLSVTPGITYDSMVDVPGIPAVSSRQDVGGIVRGNYATWNTLDKKLSITSEGNLKSAADGAGYADVITTFPTATTGKWYAEITMSFSQNINWPINMGISNGIAGNTYLRLYTDWSARAIGKSVNGVTSSVTPSGAFPATGDILKIAYDADAGNLWIGLNSTWYGASGSLTGSPETGGDPTLSGVAGRELYPNHGNAGGPAQVAYINCGQRPFSYTPPTGYKSLCTTNLPNPKIKRPSDHFDVKTWTGNGNALTVGTTNKQTSSYQIARSLRFRKVNSAFLSRTATTLGSQTTWTWSGWVKQTLFGSNGTQWLLTGGDPAAIATNYTTLAFSAQGFLGNTDQLQFYSTQSNSTVFALASNARFQSNTGWYHVVAVIDTTQTVPSERIKLYVNGVRITQWASTSFPSQNATIPFINGTTFESRIGGIVTYGNYDGYMTEINFVDGQALTPSSFGQFDANNNWVPTRYTGTYGTNGYYLPFNHNTTSSWAATFNGSQYLTVPDSSVWAFSGNWTVEAFFNISSIPGTLASIVAQWVDGGGTNRAFTIGVDSSARLTAYAQYGANQYNPVSASGLIKVNQWYHTALVANGSTLTLYLNGVAISSSSITGTINNSTAPVGIGAYGDGTWKMNGSVSNVRITNTAVYTSKFTPPSAALTAISGTQLLTLQNSTFVDNSTNNFTITNVGSTTLSSDNPFILPSIGADQSGNINNWIPNNFSTAAGVANDSVLDSPTDYDDGSGNIRGNYPVLNSLENVNTTYLAFQNGSLRANMGTGAGTMAWANMAIPPSGKWYWEVTITTVSNGTSLGISYGASSTTDGNAKSIIYSFPGGKRVLTVDTSYGASYTTGDIIGVAVDKDASTITFYKNNVSQGAISELTISSENYRPFLHNNTSSGFGLMDINFGQQPFAYTPPAGHKSLNTKNLKDVGSYNLPDTFGNFVNTPDLVWIRNRTVASGGGLFNTVIGPTRFLQPTNTNGSTTTSGELETFLPNGFLLGTNGNITNNSTNSYVGWAWNRGKIPGFDIVNYAEVAGNNSIKHNLGVVPKVVLMKSLSIVENWVWWQESFGTNQGIYLNSNIGTQTAGANWITVNSSSIEMTSGQFGSPGSKLLYLWAEVPGFSKFGTYTGNTSADGPFIYCGFKPKYLLIKKTNGNDSWIIYDSARNTYNGMQKWLVAHATDTEYDTSTGRVDFVSNGFKIRTADAGPNTGNFIYCAFAEAPFKYASAR